MDENMKDAALDVDIELTGEDNPVDSELEDIEATSSNKMKDLRDKLKACESEKMDALEQLQRAKADFLNARKRLEDERARDKERVIDAQVEKLLPLYDSFAMAMQNQEAWEKVEGNWRAGVEGIFAQLRSLLESYGVKAVTPLGETFNPNEHEALSEQSVTDQAQDHQVLAVIQAGFVRTQGEHTTLIRPARVIVGTFSN